MLQTDVVLVDTCIWVAYFNRPHSPEKRAVDELLDEDRVGLIGPVLSEILRGFRRDDEADWVASKLRGVQFLDIDWDDWRYAAKLGRDAASAGHRLPLTDLLLAAVAMNRNNSVYTTDPHFERFEDLLRYAPSLT